MLSIVWNWKSRGKLSTKTSVIWICIFVTNIYYIIFNIYIIFNNNKYILQNLIEKLNLYTCKILLFYKIIYKYVEEKQLLGEKKKKHGGPRNIGTRFISLIGIVDKLYQLWGKEGGYNVIPLKRNGIPCKSF